MGKINFDTNAHAAINWAESHPDAARDVLLLAAGYMRRGETLPDNLAEYLCDAIELSMSKDEAGQRARSLTEELHLTALNRRPAGYFIDVGEHYQNLMDEGFTEEVAGEMTAEHFTSLGAPMSKRTAEAKRKEYRAAIKEHDEISQQIWEEEQDEINVKKKP